MATLEQLAEGIRRAHQAGNAEHVRKLGAEYRRLQQQQAGSDAPPAGAVPGSPDYAKWAAEQARAGKKLPQVSEHTEWRDPLSGDLGAKAQAIGSAWLNDIPVAGPAILDLAQKGKAALWNVPLETVQADTQRAMDANPVESKTAGVLGSIASLAPLGVTAIGSRLLGLTGGTGQRIAMGTLSGATLSGADTLARGGTLAEAGQNALLGGGIGGVIPAVGAGLRRAISPVRGSADKARAAQVLQQEGVDVTAGQRTGNKGLQYREAELGGGAAEDFMERQADQFTSAALRRVGVNAPRATPDVIDTAFSDIGRMFDDLAANNDILLDAQLGHELANAVMRFRSVTAQSQRAPIVDDIARDLYNLRHQTVSGGPPQALAGAAYKDLRTRIEDARRATADSGLANVLLEMRNALDDAAERWMQRYNPSALGQWREARRLYANMLVIEDAATRAGEKAADGIITPQALRSAALRMNKRSFARGRSEFTELANAGVSALTPLPNSGTPGRLSAKTLLPLGAATGATIGSMVGGMPGAIVGAGLGSVVPWAVGRGMLSGAGRRYLGNQVGHNLPAIPLPPAALALEATRQRPLEITVP